MRSDNILLGFKVIFLHLKNVLEDLESVFTSNPVDPTLI